MDCLATHLLCTWHWDQRRGAAAFVLFRLDLLRDPNHATRNVRSTHTPEERPLPALLFHLHYQVFLRRSPPRAVHPRAPVPDTDRPPRQRDNASATPRLVDGPITQPSRKPVRDFGSPI